MKKKQKSKSCSDNEVRACGELLWNDLVPEYGFHLLGRKFWMKDSEQFLFSKSIIMETAGSTASPRRNILRGALPDHSS